MTEEQKEYKESVMDPSTTTIQLRLELLNLKIEMKEVSARLVALEQRCN